MLETTAIYKAHSQCHGRPKVPLEAVSRQLVLLCARQLQSGKVGDTLGFRAAWSLRFSVFNGE